MDLHSPYRRKRKDGTKLPTVVIGSAAGAVGGAFIIKKRLGAVRGGVVGAANAYILGKKAHRKAESLAKDQKIIIRIEN